MRARDTRKARGDAKSTQGRILEAATKVFAEHGYRDATTRMICAEAGVNVALVNYYFRSKAELYKAVTAALFEGTGKPLMALTETVHDQASWEKAMRTWIRRSLEICGAKKPPELWTARLLGMEECSPSELSHDIEQEYVLPVRRCFARLLRMAMAEEDPVEVSVWASTVDAQCVIFALTKQGWAERFCPPGVDAKAWMDRVADHICANVFARLSFKRTVD